MRTIEQILNAAFETVTAEEWERVKVYFRPSVRRRASAPLPKTERKGKRGKTEDAIATLLDD